MGFVRTTCVRAHSMAKDLFDRAGHAARWVGVNVLSVEHYEWDREGFSIVLPDGSVEVRAALACASSLCGLCDVLACVVRVMRSCDAARYLG